MTLTPTTAESCAALRFPEPRGSARCKPAAPTAAHRVAARGIPAGRTEEVAEVIDITHIVTNTAAGQELGISGSRTAAVALVRTDIRRQGVERSNLRGSTRTVMAAEADAPVVDLAGRIRDGVNRCPAICRGPGACRLPGIRSLVPGDNC